jgi:hypothetical protein
MVAKFAVSILVTVGYAFPLTARYIKRAVLVASFALISFFTARRTILEFEVAVCLTFGEIKKKKLNG